MRIGTLAALLALAACSAEPAVILDGTSPERFERSVERARHQLPEADKLAFDRALRTAGSRRLSERDAQALARTTFHGMTAAAVVEDQRTRERLGERR